MSRSWRRALEAVGVVCHIVLHHCACEHSELRCGRCHLLQVEDLDLARLDELHEVRVRAVGLAVVAHALTGFSKRWGHHVNDVVGCILLRVLLRKVGHQVEHERNRTLGEGIGRAAIGQAMALLNGQALVVIELVRLRP